jgi:hypothetical protein
MRDTPLPPDPVTLVNGLDPEAIIARLAELSREESALRVLLRAARARQRGKRSEPPTQREKVHA